MIKAILIDFAGVISQRGSVFEDLEEYMIGGMDSKKMKEAFDKAKIGEMSAKEYLSLLPQNGWDYYFKQTTVHEGLISFLENNNIPIYVASNHVSEIVQKEIDIFGVRDYFTDIFISDELKLAKPNKEFFEEILNRINLNPKDVVFIDDQKRNLVFAKEMRIKTIWVNNTIIDPFGNNSDVIPDAEIYDLSKLNEIIKELNK